jgi:hypothetical protein
MFRARQRASSFVSHTNALIVFSFLVGFSIPIVFALAVLDGYANKERLPRSRRGGEAVARQLEVAICAGAFSDVSH